MVAKKDFNAPSHIDLHKIPNLQVIKACQSLTSRGYVKTQFSWQYYYYTLTNEGIGIPNPLAILTARIST
jgi:small subunit ribosomal protein S10e